MTLTVRKPKRIITFLGAGASAAIGYPTTKPFLQKLGFYVSDEERKYLNSLRNLYWVVEDIEHVVEILNSLLELEGISERSKLSDMFYKYPRIINFREEKKYGFSPALNERVQWKSLINLTQRLRNRIEAFTFEQYGADVNRYPKIKRVFREFFSILKGHKRDKQSFEVFTTNYDNVIEDYCSQSGHTCILSVLNRELSPVAKTVSEEKCILTKLHGSLNWLIDKQTNEVQVVETQSRIRKGSPRWNRNEYILFGTKARLGISGIYDDLFKRLEDFLLKAEVCIVIGFSFRDDHINEKFTQALQQNKSLKIIIVSPSPVGSAQNLIPNRRQLKEFRSKRRIIPIKGSFGTRKVIHMTNEALIEIYSD